MPTRRRARILTLLSGESRSPSGTNGLCRTAVLATGLSGAGIMVASNGEPRGSLCGSDDVSSRVDDLQYTLGEGPSIDADREGQAVVEPNLAVPDVPRWPAFSGQAVEAGVGAIFGFPIRLGAVRLGALHLYRERPGPLTADQHADSLVMAEILAEAILALQADADVGELSDVLQTDSDFRYGVHQASGMVAGQLGISVEEASVRLRAYAFSRGKTLAEVAQAVVSRRLRLDDTDELGEPG